MLSNLNHNNILQIVGSGLGVQWEKKGKQFTGDYIATKFATNGDLFDFVRTGPLPSPVCKYLFL